MPGSVTFTSRSSGQTLLTCLLIIALPLPAADAPGDAERGRELASECAACHGPDGNSPSPAFPILAGQHEAYLYSSLKAYQSRSRDNAIMSATIVGKTDQQLRDLAAWYAAQSGLGGGAGDDSGVGVAATASGALLAEGGTDVNATYRALPDESRCPDETQTQADGDNDGLADGFDAAPDDADEFVLDTNGDGRFEICNIQQLQAILTLGEGAGKATGLGVDERMARDYQLVRDIDAAAVDNWQPIGNCGPTGNCMNDLDKYGFKGSFDGGGNMISNLTIDVPESGGVGLFGVISSGKVVRNVELRNVKSKGRAGTGTLVGSNFGTVFNCHVAGGRVEGMYAIGGLVGANAGNISFSHADIDVSGQMAVGGLVGDQNANVFMSYATGSVQSERGAGGLIGLNTRGRVVSSYATGAVSGGKEVGGLVGLNTDALVSNSYSTGAVSGSEINAGGLVGFNSNSKVINAYAAGSVQGNQGVGGLAGNNNGSIFQSYALGLVSGEADAGGLVGKNADGHIVSSFWNADTSGQTDASGTAEGVLQAVSSLDAEAFRALTGEGSGWAPRQPPDQVVAGFEPGAWFCDRDGSGELEEFERTADNYAWLFGEAAGVPALSCPPGGIDRQH